MRILEPRMLQYLHRKAGRDKIPLSGTFELSPCCNMDCRMCYVRKTREEVEAQGGEIPMESWLEIAEECRKAGMLFLLLTGGEPFLYKGFRELYMELSKMGFLISINTNGTMITEETVNWLRQVPPIRVNMTLYGAENETYRRLCRNPNGFDQTVHAAKLLKEAGISVKFNASMTPYNIEDLEGIYEIAEDLNIYVQAAAYMFPPMRRDESLSGQGDRFSPEEAARYQVKIDKLRLTMDEFKKRAETMKANHLEDLAEEEEWERDMREPLGCRAGKSAFWINWKGEMSACGIMPYPITYPFRDGFVDAWQMLVEKTRELYMPPACVKCRRRKVCHVCGASAYTETGTFGKVPQYVCEMTEHLIRFTEEELAVQIQSSSEGLQLQ
ncbi:radical SAM/SPASM domain-containing protein [Bariatricus sp. SGI.154]|uniref:radical SAM protein n=1 Tax=Bariatricus sp. SGI.154 TaxID=3420549 RepID=UPI003CFF8C00